MTLSDLIREIKILSTNGIDENTAIVIDKQNYYQKNRDWILEKKKVYNEKNKERIAEYHRNYYLDHKEHINRQHKKWYRKKIDSKVP